MEKILTFGVFDYFHLGHLRLFKQCKEHADYLIVAVQDSDYILKYKPTAKIRYSTAERVEMLEALKEDITNGIKIRRILTHQQYMANCYKVVGGE